MAGPKPMASLTPGLLARKGGAQPAMRRPVLGFGRAAALGMQDDLGWNDMGHGALSTDPVVAPPPLPAVVVERRQLENRIQSAKAVPAAPATGRKAAFTLRLDAERHLKLRLACAVERRSAQQIVTQALDVFLAGNPEIDRLAQQWPRDGGE